MKLDRCESCSLFRKNSQTCAISNREKDPIKDYCSEHKFTLYQCAICKRVPENAIIDMIDGKYIYICSSCMERLD